MSRPLQIVAWAAPLAVALAMFMVACSGGGGSEQSAPTQPPPADPPARFRELEELRKTAAFHVIYNEDAGYHVDRQEFAWVQDGTRVRWDESNTLKDAIGGISSIDDGAGTGLTCSWLIEGGSDKAEVSCDGNPRSSGMWVLQEQLNGSSVYQEDVEFAGFRIVLGVNVECFTATLRLTGDARTICYTPQAVPLEIDSVVRAGGGQHRISLTAREMRPPPSEEELLTPIIPDAALGQDVTLREIPLGELVLPDLPIVEEFFAEAQD